MNKIRINDHSLRQLKAKFVNCEFAIPEIQRQYVWNKPRVCNLMDSIFKNYPIGIGLVWTAKFSQAINIRPNNKTIIPPFNKRASHADLIIDGQQRLSDPHRRAGPHAALLDRELRGAGQPRRRALLSRPRWTPPP